MSVTIRHIDVAQRVGAVGAWVVMQGKRPDRLAAAAVIATFSLLSFVWIMRDQTVWPWDQAWYGEVALDLRYAFSRGPVAWVDAMLHAFGSKPPLISWIAQVFTPLSHLLGRTEPALLTANVLIQAVTLALVYRVGRRLGASPFEALTGMIACGGASLFIGMTNQFLVEPLQMLTAAGLANAAWGAERRSWIRVGADIVLWTALSFLSKSSAFTYVVPLITYIAVANALAWREGRPAPRRRDYWLTAFAAVTALMCMLWYQINWAAMAVHFKNATSAEITLDYGSVGTLSSKLHFWTTWLGLSLSPWSWILWMYIALAVAAFGRTILKFNRASPRDWPKIAVASGFLFAGAVAGIVVITVLGLALQINEETRFLAPLLPLTGVLIAWGLHVFARSWLTIAISAIAGTNALAGAAYAQGFDPLHMTPTTWLKPVQTDTAPSQALQVAVVASCKYDRPNRYVIVGVEYPWFNANSAAFYSAMSRRHIGYRCFYTSLGYAQKDIEAALKRVDEMDADFVITIAPDKQIEPPNFVNLVSKPVVERLAADSRFKRVPDMPGNSVIFERQR